MVLKTISPGMKSGEQRRKRGRKRDSMSEISKDVQAQAAANAAAARAREAERQYKNRIQNAAEKLRDEQKVKRAEISALKKEISAINEIANADILESNAALTALKVEVRALEAQRLMLRQITGA